MSSFAMVNDAEGSTALLVQTAQSVDFSNGRICLHNISPTTIYMSSRGQGIVGHISTSDLVNLWRRDTSTLSNEPPAAALSFLNQVQQPQGDVVVRLDHPTLDKHALTYSATILEGALFRQNGACTLFIDVLGRPVSPVSFTASLRLTRDRDRWLSRRREFMESLASL